MRIPVPFIALVLLLALAQTTPAFPPVFVLSATGGTTVQEDAFSGLTATPMLDSRASFSYRSPIPSGGYAAVGLDGSLRYYFGEVDDYQDQEVLSFELARPLRRGRLMLSAGTTSSLQPLSASGSFVQPDWSLGYRFPEIGAGIQPEATYTGLYRYEDDGVEDVTRHELSLGFVAEPSVRIGYSAHLNGAWELYPEQAILNADGSESGALRNDVTASITGGAEGLIGFFTSWEMDAELGFRGSNANRYLSGSGSAESELEANSESRLFGRVNGSLELSPVQQLGIGSSLTVGDTYYLDRAALRDDGTPRSKNLNRFDIGGSLYADWTPNNAVYFLIEASVSRQISTQPSLDGWSAEVTGGVEYSF
jgi:hypothetical protein